MEVTQQFLELTLDTVKNNIVVVDANFNIIFVNKTWIEFGLSNGYDESFNWIGVNYIHPIETSAADGDEFSSKALAGLKQVHSEDVSEFTLEYPCHSPIEDKWFSMQVSRFVINNKYYFVISHQNITQRVKLELEAKRLARIDSLTGLANRRAFDEFLDSEWKHCKRCNSPISIAIIDLDRLKYFNDNFGHQIGDDCLITIANVLRNYCGRASDICARYGGDEFVIVWGNISKEKAYKLSTTMLSDIRKLNAKTAEGKDIGKLTVSIGVHSINPHNSKIEDLILQADKLMYKAKQSGKNKVCVDA